MRTGDYKQTHSELVALIDSPPVWLWSAVLLLALIAAPFLLNSYALSFLMIILITVTGALGLNILTGYTGLISLGHVGFLVTGAYAYAVLVSKYQMPPPVGFLGAGVIVRQGDRSQVHGLTSAACAFFAACVGIVCGAGHWPIALTALALAFLLLTFGRRTERWLHHALGGKDYPHNSEAVPPQSSEAGPHQPGK